MMDRIVPGGTEDAAPRAPRALQQMIEELEAPFAEIVRLYDDTLEDLAAIAPQEMLRGYRFSFGYTVDGVEVVAQHRQPQRGREQT